MQLRQRKSERAAVSKQQSATRNAARRIAAAADAPTAPLAATPLPAAAPADVAELTAPAAPPRKKRKAPQDIGIPELLLGQGLPTAEAVEAVDRLALRAAGFTPDTLQAACEFLARADPSECCMQAIEVERSTVTNPETVYASMARALAGRVPARAPAPLPAHSRAAELAPLIEQHGPPERLLAKQVRLHSHACRPCFTGLMCAHRAHGQADCVP